MQLGHFHATAPPVAKPVRLLPVCGYWLLQDGSISPFAKYNPQLCATTPTPEPWRVFRVLQHSFQTLLQTTIALPIHCDTGGRQSTLQFGRSCKLLAAQIADGRLFANLVIVGTPQHTTGIVKCNQSIFETDGAPVIDENGVFGEKIRTAWQHGYSKLVKKS